jgi:hypothetical protein
MRVLRSLLLFPIAVMMLPPARGQVAEKSPATLSPAVTRYVKVPAAEWIVLKNVRVIDGTGAPAIEKTDVVIHNGKIDSIGTGETILPAEIVLDLSGHTVFPGLVGMHDHLYNIARPNLNAAGNGAAAGVFVDAPVPWRGRDDAAHDRVRGTVHGSEHARCNR